MGPRPLWHLPLQFRRLLAAVHPAGCLTRRVRLKVRKLILLNSMSFHLCIFSTVDVLVGVDSDLPSLSHMARRFLFDWQPKRHPVMETTVGWERRLLFFDCSTASPMRFHNILILLSSEL